MFNYYKNLQVYIPFKFIDLSAYKIKLVNFKESLKVTNVSLILPARRRMIKNKSIDVAFFCSLLCVKFFH